MLVNHMLFQTTPVIYRENMRSEVGLIETIADLLMLLLSPKMPDKLNEHTSCANTAVQGI